MYLKLVYFLPLLLIFLIPQAFALNTLENEHLFAESGIITLDIQFGEDDIKYGLSRVSVTNTLDDVTLKFYGDEISLSDPQVKVSSTGEHFRISSVEDGIIMYGHYNEDLKNYKINVYFAGQNGMVKYTVNTAAELQDDKVIEKESVEVKEKYIPDLIITVEQDYRTYWNENFNIQVRAYDKHNNNNPQLNPFQGKVNDANVTAIISFDGNTVATLNGITENGQWQGQHYFMENLSAPGEYIIDVIVSNLGKTASYSSSMFVIGTTPSDGSSSSNNIPPVADAGLDQLLVAAGIKINLDGNASFDSDGTIVSYSWIQTNGPPTVTINNANTATPDFDTLGAGDTYIFELTVTDNKGSTSKDTVTVTVS